MIPRECRIFVIKKPFANADLSIEEFVFLLWMDDHWCMAKQDISGGVVHTLPTEMRKVLTADKAALALWESLTPLARNEWICWVISMKQPETKRDHLERVCPELKDGMRRPCCWIGCIHRKDKAISPSVRSVLNRSANKKVPTNDAPASKQIDAIIKKAGGWKGKTVSTLRALIKKADPSIVEEVKWKMPSRPEGVAVWSHEGIVCMASILKNSIILTFVKGASLKDPKKLFNSRLKSKKDRGIDLHEGETIDEAAFKNLVRDAVALNRKN
jgi:hypothetical protein